MFSQQRVLKQIMKPSPPVNLSKEFRRVWLGWCSIGDREVAREAAAKGTYISLALQFLATRKQWDRSDVDRWFQTEILTWVYQLLEQKQIFKASHILSNIGLDYSEQFACFLSETTNKSLRDYIGDHLWNIGKLDLAVLNTWKLIQAVESASKDLIIGHGFIYEEDISKASIISIDQKNREWKANIATVLFFHNYDFFLESFLYPESAWKYLILNEKLIILKIWINVYFSKDLTYNTARNVLDPEICQKLKSMFLFWEITDQMINEISSGKFNSQNYVNEFVLNELTSFGIFVENERNTLPLVLGRFAQTRNIRNIYQILGEPTSYLNINAFAVQLNDYCIEHELYEVLCACSINKSKCYHSNLSDDTKQRKQLLSLWLLKGTEVLGEDGDCLGNDLVFYKHLTTALFYFIDESNILPYLAANPLVLIAIVLFHPTSSLYDIVFNNLPLDINGSIILKSEDLVQLLKQLPILQNLFLKEADQTNLFEELLRKYLPGVQSKVDLECVSSRKNLFAVESKVELECSNKSEFTTAKNLLVEGEDRTDLLNDFLSENQSKDELEYSNNLVSKNSQASLNQDNEEIIVKNNSNTITLSSCDVQLKDDLEYSNSLASENVSYLYYIREGRPSKAAKFLLLHVQARLDQELEEVIIKHHSNSDVLSSCVAFLGMIGSRNEHLWNLISVIHLFGSNPPSDFTNQLLNISAQSEPILQAMESILQHASPKEDTILSLIHPYRTLYNFSKLHHLESPTQLLAHCVQNNYWLPFLIFIQLYDYSDGQIAHLVEQFADKQIAEHLQLGVLNMSKRFVCLERMELLNVLIKCYASGDPPTTLLQACQMYKKPVLAILATCYEPDSVILNWLNWLAISANLDITVTDNFPFAANKVSHLMEQVLQKQFIRTLLDSFKIFLPDNPLHYILKFLFECVSLKHFDTSTQHLKLFEKSVKHLRCNSVIMLDDFEYTYLNNKYWIIETSLKLIFIALGNCLHSTKHQIVFLELLSQVNWTRNVPINCPNFKHLVELLAKFTVTDVRLNLGKFFVETERVEELKRCIEICVERRQFELAYILAAFGNVHKEFVLNEQWSEKFQNELNPNFWLESNQAFETASVAPEWAAGFYVRCCQALTDCADKYKALKLGYKWMKQSNCNVHALEHDIWFEYFALDDVTLRNSTFELYGSNHLLSEIYDKVQLESAQIRDKGAEASCLEEEQLRHFEETIGKILASGDIIEALRLEKMFNYRNAEVSILLTCYELAEGKMKPFEMNAEQRLILSNRRRTPSVMVDEGDDEENETSDDSAQASVLHLLEMMSDRLKYGSEIANRILMCYRIAMNVHQTYQTIVTHSDSVQLMRTALRSNCNKLQTITDILTVFRWPRIETMRFICNELQTAIEKNASELADYVTMWDLNLNQQFHLVLRLCPEINSLLGQHLLKMTDTFFVRDDVCDERFCYVVTELLIRSHDCFQTYCNMEGIAAVLRKAQHLTSMLLNAKLWKRMVRLLTGIARYTEMHYIFHILKENDQFEFLLRREFRNDNGLKTAVIKYLKRHCAKDQDLYRIVALHFNLYSEVATLWETEAQQMIRNLIEIANLEVQNQSTNEELYPKGSSVPFTNNYSTHMCLSKAMLNYEHAAEYHLQGGKLSAALHAAQQAELIALQRSLLNTAANNATVASILNNTAQQFIQFISTDTLLSFQQIRIFMESYNNYSVDWGLVLYTQCIKNGRLDYLRDYTDWKPLSYTLVQDVTRRFLASQRANTAMAVNGMKEMLKQFSSVQMRYRIASELGFADVVEEMLLAEHSQLAYLKDTVWKKGYKHVSL